MTTLNLLRVSSSSCVVSTFFTRTFCFSTRERTSLTCALTRRAFCSSLSTVVAVAPWSWASLRSSDWTALTELSSCCCRSSMRCWLAWTPSMIVDTRSSRERIDKAETGCPDSSSTPSITSPLFSISDSPFHTSLKVKLPGQRWVKGQTESNTQYREKLTLQERDPSGIWQTPPLFTHTDRNAWI